MSNILEKLTLETLGRIKFFRRFFKKSDGTWDAEKVIDVPAKKVEGYAEEEINGKRVLINFFESDSKNNNTNT